MEITLIKDNKQQTHKMPMHWNDITLETYVKVIKKAKQVGLRELEKVVHIINIISGIEEEDLLRLPTKNIAQLGGYVGGLIKSLPEDELKHIIEIDGIEYGFHPKLSDISMGEWVDIDTYISNGVEDNLHKIMSVLYRPITDKIDDKYRIEEYKPCKVRQELFKTKMKVGDFYGVSVFFSDLGRELLQTTLKSSIAALKQKSKDRDLDMTTETK
tara:strand:+ start:894 stop:1535 length:642 start_codon:yes stop_codon:yes gene_type:complete